MNNNNMKIEVGKFYTTRDGKKVRIYATDGIDKYPIHGAYLGDLRWHSTGWTRNGGYYYGVNQLDIVSEWQEPLDFDWSCLPKWADKYIAMNVDGLWYCFSTEPKHYTQSWIDKYSATYIYKDYKPKNFNKDWKDSLFMNPKYK